MTVAHAISPFDRDQQFSAKKQAVIASAAAAFRRRGYHNTSMVEIAQTLGLTKAALYYYVRNKEEILYESHRITYAAIDNILNQANEVEGPGMAQLETIFRNIIAHLTESGASLLTDVNSLGEERRTDILSRRSQIEKKIINVVKRGQSDGSIRAGDPRLHVFFFMGALNWLTAWFDAGGRLSGQDISDHFAAQLKQGIAA